jgi:release factor glutamine methyltransferase
LRGLVARDAAILRDALEDAYNRQQVTMSATRMNTNMQIGETLLRAAHELDPVSDSPRLDAELLMTQALDVGRAYLIAHPEDTLDASAMVRFDALLRRRLGGEPMAYISGSREFWSMSLMVSPATLIPRPETELLVQQALLLMARDERQQVLDIGTGSGAVALALAKERPESRVTATDISEDALAVARENARQNDIFNVSFLAGRWFEPVRGRTFDLVVSNPPYICDDDPALEKLVHEPRAALVAGPDGLDAIRALAGGGGQVLRTGGTLLLEHGSEQQQAVADVLRKHGWSDVRCCNDLAGLPRVTTAVHNSRSCKQPG